MTSKEMLKLISRNRKDGERGNEGSKLGRREEDGK
jgi:hypothetical protein